MPSSEARTDGPRTNRETSEIERKLALLDAPHIRPLTQFVCRLRAQRDDDDIPYFDPTEAGVKARILLLLEAPGPRSTSRRGSGFISPDNNDTTAANMWALLKEAGFDRSRELATWNVVPWYVGDGTRIRAVTVADIDEARLALLDLLQLLTNLKVVVLVGRKAARGWARLGIETPTVEAPHPSPVNLNINPKARERILEALLEARDALHW